MRIGSLNQYTLPVWYVDNTTVNFGATLWIDEGYMKKKSLGPMWDSSVLGLKNNPAPLNGQ